MTQSAPTFFRVTALKMLDGDRVARYVETVRVNEVGHHAFTAESDMWGRDDRQFNSAELAARQLAYKASAAVQKIEVAQ